MIDSAPFDKWGENITVFWTFGDGTPTYILTVLGIILMIVSLIAWMWLEEKKLTQQVSRLKAAGGAGGTLTPSPYQVPGTGGDDA
jgi:TM2 domain-containing membrane protein YozV